MWSPPNVSTRRWRPPLNEANANDSIVVSAHTTSNGFRGAEHNACQKEIEIEKEKEKEKE